MYEMQCTTTVNLARENRNFRFTKTRSYGFKSGVVHSSKPLHISSWVDEALSVRSCSVSQQVHKVLAHRHTNI